MLLALLIIAFAWLVPNHYFPWSSAWSEGVAISGLLLLSLKLSINNSGGSAISSKLGVAAVLTIGTVTLQFLLGREFFWGDVVMVVLYTLLWVMALIAGRELVEVRVGAIKGLDCFQTVLLLSAVLSIGIALVQWTGVFSLGIYAVDLPPGARPFGNVAQPNHLCTICFLGFCSLIGLREQNRIGNITFWMGSTYVLFGMVMTQSRTGWLQMLAFVIFALAFKSRSFLKIRPIEIFFLLGIFICAYVIWPLFCEIVLLAPGRSVDDLARAGVRIPYWTSMVAAIFREPLLGYGWLQIGAAQQLVASDFPSISIFFEHSHNLLFDLLLANGIFVGLIIFLMLIFWFWRHLNADHDVRIFGLILALLGIFVHAGFEYPLEYAYFLIPVGVMMGAIDRIAMVGGLVFISKRVLLFLVGLLAVVFPLIAVDYFEAENNYRILRMESARIGVDRIETPASKLYLLTQLEAFLRFARLEAHPSMTAEELDWMRKVALRFGYPPVLFRYALAAGLNGQPENAEKTILLICKIHSSSRCDEAIEGWKMLGERYPQLPNIKNYTKK